MEDCSLEKYSESFMIGIESLRKVILVLPDEDRCQDQEDLLKMSLNDHKESPHLTSRRLKQSR